MTRDELIEIIELHVEVFKDYELDMETGDCNIVYRVTGADKAADAILAKLELEKKIALSGGTIELLTLLGVAL